MNANFVSLHNHTEYSFLDGAIKVKALVKKAKEFGMPALAITDHGGLFGAVEFYEVCRKEGIKPILGFEAYVAPGSRFEKSQVKEKDERYYSHLILLAKDNIGWKNLMRLSSIGYLEGFYYKPRIDMEVLRQYSEGIIATSACAAGAIPLAIRRGDMEGARKLAREYIDIFGKDNFYFELQDHGIEDEKVAMDGVIKLGRELGVPFIVANDAHYLLREDAPSHEVLLCIGTKDTLDNPGHYKFSSDEIYFKSPEEMAKLFPDIPEAMTNTLEIAQRCNVDISVEAQLPSVDVPDPFTGPDDYLAHLARKGLRERYAEVTPELEEKLEFELKVISGMKFSGYFLIVLDFVQKARDMDILVGCRGSAAGCLVFYAIGVTDVDPIKFGLLFERFLNPERKSMPDADIDLADRDRQKIIDYIVDKYGRDSVCQIINFGTMGAKNVVRDVARTMGVSVGESTRLTSMIPKDPKMTLKEALGIPPRIKVKKEGKMVEVDNVTPHLSAMLSDNTLQNYTTHSTELFNTLTGSSAYKTLIRHAAVLEGLTRQPGMHPAGMIIAPGKVADWAPLFKQSGAEEIMTQFDMRYVENIGLVKMDLLGLKTLTVIQEALRLIKKYHKTALDPWKLPDDDQKTLDIFGSGETTGIFQFESGGMRDYLRKLKPSNIEDIIAMVALYRPGPMDNIDMFINRKYGREKVEYPHPLLEESLKVTYGVIVYQEQVMRVAQEMGSFTRGEADELRKAMGKKDVEKMAKMGNKFVEGAVSQKIDKKTARDVYDIMEKFAGYGFNKAHAAVYAHLSYQTAYLKAHYPIEYMTAYLTAYLGDKDEFLKMRNEAQRLGIRVLPPDVNSSDNEFSVDGGSIRVGLGAVKNVGKAAELILKAREEDKRFTSMFDVCKSTDNRIVNKKALESLICAGAFDGFGAERSQYMAAVDMALEYGKSFQAERAAGQVNLFDDILAGGGSAEMAAATEPALPGVAPWPLSEQLQKEKEILGFYASGHPLDQFLDDIRAFTDVDIADEEFAQIKHDTQVTIAGVISAHKPHFQKNGRPMGFLTLEVFDKSIELIAFADAYDKYRDMFEVDSKVLVSGRIINKDEVKPKLSVEGCMHLYMARETLAKSIHVKMSTGESCEERVKNFFGLCNDSPGDCYLLIHVTAASGNRYRVRSGNTSVSPDLETIERLRGLFGKENVWISKTIS
jgi:DNA polymerase-3 subunit alpha